MTSPYPGLVLPAPRTWAKGDLVTTPRLRGDMTNLGALFVSGRPLFQGGNLATPSVASGSDVTVPITFAYANNWNLPVNNSTQTQTFYFIPLAGYYLVQGSMALNGVATTPASWKYAMGFNAIVNGASAASSDGGSSIGSTSSTPPVAMSGAELYQFNPATTDSVRWYVFYNATGAATTLLSATMQCEWVGLPTSGLTSYTGPYGTVVNPPVAAAAFPPGPGTTLASPASAGATSITVASNTGMVVGGTLGLDVISSQQYQPVAEAVTISSVAGTTIGISATNYAHASGAPIAVPVSAAFLNQQSRDLINYLAYPPMCRAATTTTQSIPNQTFPSVTQVTNLSATIDTFSGFSSNSYTIPVAGIWYVYAQVYFAGTTAAFEMGCGIQVNGGTTDWGTAGQGHTPSTAQTMCMTYSRHLRCSKGDVVTLQAFQDSGAAMNTVHTAQASSRMIFLWRAF